MTSTPGPLLAEPGWLTNARGRKFNHKVPTPKISNNRFPKKFGYGLMDTGAMVELASKWRNVPLQHICQSAVMKTDMQVLSLVPHVPKSQDLFPAQIPDDIGGRARVSMTSDGCAGTINAVNHLEHIQCKVKASTHLCFCYLI